MTSDRNDLNRSERSKLSCDSFADDLAHFVLGELAGEMRPALERHLVECAACRAEREILVHSVALVKQHADASAPVLELSPARRAELLAQATGGTSATPLASTHKGTLPLSTSSTSANSTIGHAQGDARVVRPIFGTFERWAAAAAAIVGVTLIGECCWRGEGVRSRATNEEVALCAKTPMPSPTPAPSGRELRDVIGFREGPDGRRYCGPADTSPPNLAKPSGESPPPTDAGSSPSVLDFSGPATTYDFPDVDTSTATALEGLRRDHAAGDTMPVPPVGGSGESLSILVEDGTHSPTPSKNEAAPAASSTSPNSTVASPPGNPSGPAAPVVPSSSVAGGGRGPTTGGLSKNQAFSRKGLGDSAPRGRAAAANLKPEERVVLRKQRDGEELTADEKRILRAARQAIKDESASALQPTSQEGQVTQRLGVPLGIATGGKNPSPAPKPAAASPAPLAKEDRERLQQLGYDDGVAFPGTVGGTFGNGPGPETYSFTARQQVVSTGYAVDGNGDLESTVVPAAALAAMLADADAPSTILALQPKLAVALGLDPNTPRGEDADARGRELVKDFLDRLAPRQGETPRDMFFRYFGDHPFVSTRYDTKSTFGMDVDHASYALVRNYLKHGVLPPKAAVRTEEFVNSFRHDLAPPSRETPSKGDSPDGGDVFAIHSEMAPSPFGENGQYLLEIGMKAREVSRAERRPAALTFIVDVSGSMEEEGRLESVKASLKMLVSQLDERDTIGVVCFSTDAHRVLDPTNAGNRDRIFAALDTMRPDGSTNADAGLRLGYDMALEQLRPSAENRVIFCTDGVANVGCTDPKVLSRRAKECKAKNLFLTCVGVGFDNHNDALLEQLADETDGTCDYLDRMDEAKKIFVDKFVGTLTTVARDAKIQVEFDPKSVRRFRQLGYEKRALAHQDFRNDRVDAGEVGAGAEVIALYELELQPDASGPLGTVRCRYAEPRSSQVHEQARELFVAEAAPSLAKTTARFRLAACVAEFAELLRQSVHARDGSFGAVEQLAEPLVAELAGDPDVPEFVALVKQAARLPDLLPRRTELTRACDELKRFRCVREEFKQSDAAKDAANDELMKQMEEQNRRLEEALRKALEKAAR